jgi:hypothetical protein
METSTDSYFKSAFSLCPYCIACLCVILICVITLYCFWGLIGIAVFLPIILLGLTIGGYCITKQNVWRTYAIHKNKIVCYSKFEEKVIGFESIIKLNLFTEGLVVEYFENDNSRRRMSLVLGKKTAEAYAKLNDAYNEWGVYEVNLRNA